MAGPFYASSSDGSDSDNGLSLANAFLTINQLVNSIGNGEQGYVLGTFSENTGGVFGRNHFDNSFTTAPTIEAYDAGTRPVIRGDGTLTTYSNTQQGARYYFKNLDFTSNPGVGAGAGHTTTVYGILHATATNTTWDGVKFDASMVSGTPRLFYASFTGTGTGWTFTDCQFLPPSNAANMSFAFEVGSVTAGVASPVFTRIVSTAPRFSLNNCTGVVATDCSWTCTHGTPIQLGVDADSGGGTNSGTMSNCRSSATGASGTHGMLIGHGASGWSIVGHTVLECGDYGLVAKSCSGNTVYGGSFAAGPGSGKSALLCKGSTGLGVHGTTWVANGSAFRCINITANDATTDVSGIVMKNCRFMIRGGGQAYLWAAAEDGGSNIIDHNLYTSNSFGDVNSVTCRSIGQLRAAWGTAKNDQHSRTVNTARHHGLRNRRQRLVCGRSA